MLDSKDKTTFSVEDNGVVHYNLEKVGDSNWKTIYSDGIYGAKKYKYETSVENVATSVIAHEWYGHYKRRWGKATKNHRYCYAAAMNSVWYSQTTQKYKSFYSNKYLELYINETNNK